MNVCVSVFFSSLGGMGAGGAKLLEHGGHGIVTSASICQGDTIPSSSEKKSQHLVLRGSWRFQIGFTSDTCSFKKQDVFVVLFPKFAMQKISFFQG